MVIDNRENGRVIDALTEAISKGADLKFITRQLSLFAYYRTIKKPPGCENPRGLLFRCTPEKIRTSNRLIRSQVLYPVELRVHFNK